MNFISEFIKFTNDNMSTQTRWLNPFMDNQPLVGEYWIYQRNLYQPKWVSYNFQQLKEICNADGGYVADKEGNIVYYKLIINQ